MLIDNPAAMLLEIFKKTKELKGDSNCAAVWKVKWTPQSTQKLT